MQKNPHFDDNRFIWDDSYSGEYKSVVYDEQFDDQWRLFLEKKTGFYRHTGVETDDKWIDERIFELTGVKNFLLLRKWKIFTPIVNLLYDLAGIGEKRLAIGGTLLLEPKFPIDYFQNKKCLDVGCGAGRWSKTLNSLGANVTAIDVSRHGLLSTKRYVDDVRKLSLFDIGIANPPLTVSFDFTLCWGVIMCTHDPKVAFENVASTIKPGGELYIMVYAPTYHVSENVITWRKQYHMECKSFEEKLAFAYKISDCPENAINNFDMLNTFYNWTISEATIRDWFGSNGFHEPVFLNKNEVNYCAYHVLARKR